VYILEEGSENKQQKKGPWNPHTWTKIDFESIQRQEEKKDREKHSHTHTFTVVAIIKKIVISIWWMSNWCSFLLADSVLIETNLRSWNWWVWSGTRVTNIKLIYVRMYVCLCEIIKRVLREFSKPFSMEKIFSQPIYTLMCTRYRRTEIYTSATWQMESFSENENENIKSFPTPYYHISESVLMALWFIYLLWFTFLTLGILPLNEYTDFYVCEKKITKNMLGWFIFVLEKIPAYDKVDDNGALFFLM
jgi:hypothetical protein